MVFVLDIFALYFEFVPFYYLFIIVIASYFSSYLMLFDKFTG